MLPQKTIVALHDRLPVELPMTGGGQTGQSIDPRRKNMWTGNVWRTVLLLKRRRPDLSIVTLNAAPAGLAMITNLDPGNRSLGGDLQCACIRDAPLVARRH
jgi:hypothetical protein